VVYAFGFYFHHLDYGYYIKPYVDGDFDLGYSRLLDWFLNYRLINCSLPLLMKEGGFGLKDEWQNWDISMRHTYQIWTDCNIGWFTWLWWSNSWSYGLCNEDWTLNDPIGVIWAQYLPSFP
jgi:hypothetical protein